MNYAALLASNLSGEAVRATVQAPGRSIGSTSIPVNAITDWPTGTFIATTGTLLSTGILNPATAQVFYGTASGTTVTITSFAPGYTDLGNSVGDVVVIKPTTEWANTIGTHIKNITGNGTPEPVTASTLNSNGNPVWQYLGSYSGTSSFSTANGSPTQVPNFTSTVTVPTGYREVKVSVSGGTCSTTVNSKNLYLALYRGTAGSGTQVGYWQFTSANANYSAPFSFFGLDTPGAGSVTYNLATWADTSGNIYIGGAQPISLVVDCC